MCEHGVEVVRYATGQASHRLHFLCLPVLLIESVPLRHVFPDAQAAQGPALLILQQRVVPRDDANGSRARADRVLHGVRAILTEHRLERPRHPRQIRCRRERLAPLAPEYLGRGASCERQGERIHVLHHAVDVEQQDDQLH